MNELEIPKEAIVAAAALSHHTRFVIISHLVKHGEGSPSEISQAVGDTGASLGTISYHMRMLRDSGVVEITRAEPRRGAMEHYYKISPAGFESLSALADTTRTILKTNAKVPKAKG